MHILRLRRAAAAALLVAAASASDFENWNPNERDPDGKTDAQLLVERAEFVREQIDDGGHLDADHDHKRGHVDIVAPDEPALRAAIERANAMPESKSVSLPETDLSWHWEAYLRDAMILTGCAFIVVLAVVVMWPLLSQHRKRVANEAGEYEYEGVAQAPSKKQ